jgi:hypothetical protein
VGISRSTWQSGWNSSRLYASHPPSVGEGSKADCPPQFISHGFTVYKPRVHHSPDNSLATFLLQCPTYSNNYITPNIHSNNTFKNNFNTLKLLFFFSLLYSYWGVFFSSWMNIRNFGHHDICITSNFGHSSSFNRWANYGFIVTTSSNNEVDPCCY